MQATIQPAGSVTFEHRNLQGLNRSILGSVTSNNLFNPQVTTAEYLSALSSEWFLLQSWTAHLWTLWNSSKLDYSITYVFHSSMWVLAFEWYWRGLLYGSLSTECWWQDDLGFKAEYVHPYVDGVDDPRNRTFRASCFNSRKLSAVFTGGPGVEEVPSVWVDRAGIKANLTEVIPGHSLSKCNNLTYVLQLWDHMQS
jgi:hypothetical protein